jgi:hypothetical protein
MKPFCGEDTLPMVESPATSIPGPHALSATHVGAISPDYSPKTKPGIAAGLVGNVLINDSILSFDYRYLAKIILAAGNYFKHVVAGGDVVQIYLCFHTLAVIHFFVHYYVAVHIRNNNFGVG